MRDNVNILEKYIENLVVKKNLLQTTVDAYKLDINEYLEFLTKKDIDILDTDEKILNEYFSDVEKINKVCEYKVSDFETSFNSDDNCMEITLKLDIDHTIEPIREYAKFNKRAGTISITATTSLIDEAMDMFKEDLMLDDEDNEDEEFEEDDDEDDDEDFFDLDKTELEIYHSFDITKYISKERLLEIAFNNKFVKNDILKVMKQIIEKYYEQHSNEYYDNKKK